MQKLSQCGLVHVEDGVERAETKEFRDDRCAHSGSENFSAYCALLGRKDAHPDLIGFGALGPELKKPLEISGLVGDLAGNRAVDRNARLRKVLQYTLVGRRCATFIVFGLQPVDRDNYIEAFVVRPVSRNWTEGAGNDLGVDAATVELGQDGLELAVADEWVAAYQRDV